MRSYLADLSLLPSNKQLTKRNKKIEMYLPVFRSDKAVTKNSYKSDPEETIY